MPSAMRSTSSVTHACNAHAVSTRIWPVSDEAHPWNTRFVIMINSATLHQATRATGIRGVSELAGCFSVRPGRCSAFPAAFAPIVDQHTLIRLPHIGTMGKLASTASLHTYLPISVCLTKVGNRDATHLGILAWMPTLASTTCVTSKST